jgi:hypothetical protein
MLAMEVAMPSQPSVGVASTFTRAEWDLLVRLPGQVVVAATSAEADSPRRTVAEGLAGIDAIAAGLDSRSPLVRSIVAAIYAEQDDSEPIAEEFADRTAGLASVIASCQHVSAVLGTRCDAENNQAYRDWLTMIATRVCEASRSGGLLGVGGAQVSAAERRFLAEMSAAFGG